MEAQELEKFEQKIGVTFSNKDLLQQAFVHRSYINENKEKGLNHNERLEFLGDAVLELVVTDFLFKKYSNKHEGDLTSYRSALVNTNTLSDVADGLGVNDFLMLSKGESQDNGRARLFILANTYEAIVGAIYLDQGYDIAKSFIEKTIFPLTDEIVEKELWKDSKSRLQEVAQEKLSTTPRYQVLKESGPDHERIFTVGVYFKDELIAQGKGGSKQEAEQDAATAALMEKGW
jgi:ribonuclease III